MEFHDLPIFTIRDFSFTYPLSKKGVRINGKIDIHKGERVLLKGPSGSGKSTLLLALSGIVPHEIAGRLEGEVIFRGKPISSFPPAYLHRSIGIVFQNPYSQKVTSSIEDELVFYLENLGFNPEEIDTRLKKIYGLLKLSSLLEKSPKTLSGGELQKIILASVLIAEPEVLLFDEPTSYLDVKSEISFYKYLLENLKDQTIITVDHKLNHNIRLINRVIELDSRGNIVFDGPKDDYIKHYRKIIGDAGLKKIRRTWVLNNFNSIKKQFKRHKLKLEIKNLNFSYETEHPVLKNVNLSIETGSVTSIFGLNGSGKTTLIKLAARLMKAQTKKNNKQNILKPEFCIRTGNEEDEKITKKRQFYNYIGVVFQNPETHFLFQTVGKEITNGRCIGVAEEIAEAFNITDNIRQNPFTLSEGQKRRLNLANTFYLGKQIVLLDEPTFGQDETGILNLIKTIGALKKSGVGFLVASHDRRFIKSISDRVFYLKDGELTELKRIKKPLQEIGAAGEYN